MVPADSIICFGCLFVCVWRLCSACRSNNNNPNFEIPKNPCVCVCVHVCLCFLSFVVGEFSFGWQGGVGAGLGLLPSEAAYLQELTHLQQDV